MSALTDCKMLTVLQKLLRTTSASLVNTCWDWKVLQNLRV